MKSFGFQLLCTLAFLALALSSAMTLRAQSEETSDRELNLAEVRSLRRQVEAKTGLEGGEQKQLLELYDQTVADLESANQAQTRVRRHELERTQDSIQSGSSAHRTGQAPGQGGLVTS